MEYTINPDGTINIVLTNKQEEDRLKVLDKEMLERMGTYDTHKLFN